MARHSRKRSRRGRIIKGVVDEALTLGTLASTTLVGGAYDDSVQQRTFLISHTAVWYLRNATALEAGVLCGFAHSDYSDAEIEEFIENTGSWDEGDLIGQEVGKRKVRIVGQFSGLTSDLALNDGKPIYTKCMWILNSGDSLRLWAYNLSGGALTTGSVMTNSGHVWLRPTG